MKRLWLLFVLSCSLLANGPKKALIFGITGQDGSYLAELLLEKGYEVHGVKRRASSFNTQRLDHIYRHPHYKNRKLILHYGDLTDSLNLAKLIKLVMPDEIYNLGAQSHVQVSFEEPEYTANCDGIGALRILEAIHFLGLEKTTKYYQASTSELYGKVREIPQSETTPFYPRSPYATGKLFGYWTTVNYREAYGIFACNGILFNHESPRRGGTFVTKKITQAIVKIKYGQQECLYLGNLDSKRDWGHAPDYVYAMWLILQYDTPEDWVVATGETHTVREFLELSCKEVGITLEWQGRGVDEVGIDSNTGKIIIKIDPRYYRPTEVDLLLGDPTKINTKLGWKPKVGFEELVKIMIRFDLDQHQNSSTKERAC